MTMTFDSKTAASAAALAAGLALGEFTVTKEGKAWTYTPNQTALTLVQPTSGQGTEQQLDGATSEGQQDEQPQGSSTPADEQPAVQQPSEAPKAAPKVTFLGAAFPTVEHAIAWAKVDGFAKNRIKVEPVLGGFLFRPLAEGEKYEAIGSASTPRNSGAPAFPAPGTKKRLLIEMVCRPEGATMKELEDAVGWKKCSGTLNELDETFGLEIEYRKKGKEGRYFGTFPAAHASTTPAGEQQEQTPPLAA